MLPSVFDYSPELAKVLYKTAEDYRSPDPNTTGDPADEEDRQLPRHPALHALGTVGAGLAGTGVGMLAGRGAYELARHISGNKMTPNMGSTIAPALGAGAGMAYGLYKHHEMEELKRALKAHQNQPKKPGV